MGEIGIRELKSGASRVIDEVEAGASYVVTKRAVRPRCSCLLRKLKISSWPTPKSMWRCVVGHAAPTRKGGRTGWRTSPDLL